MNRRGYPRDASPYLSKRAKFSREYRTELYGVNRTYISALYARQGSEGAFFFVKMKSQALPSIYSRSALREIGIPLLATSPPISLVTYIQLISRLCLTLTAISDDYLVNTASLNKSF